MATLPSITTETFICMEGDELEQFILEKYGQSHKKRPDFAGTGNIPGDDSDGYHIASVEPGPIDKWDQESLDAYIITGSDEVYIIDVVLKIEVNEGSLPEGNYRIHFCWGVFNDY
jgi:hypothetical protein